MLGLKYKEGVLIACDTLCSYGSLARFRGISRLQTVGANTILGASGEYSDFQKIQDYMDQLLLEDCYADDGSRLQPREIFRYLSTVMYQRRSKVDPLWNSLVIGGFRNGQSFLGQVDLQGTHFEDESIATGYGAYLARPVLREALKRKASSEITLEEAQQLLITCLRVLFYRECRTINSFQMAKADASGVVISEPFSVNTTWTFKGF